MLSSFLGRWRWPSRPQYNALEEALSEDEIDIEGEKEGSQIQLVRNKIRPWYRRPVFPLAGLVLLGVLFAGLGLGYILQGFGHQASNRESTDDYTCTESKISLRREWRTLNKIEQREYVQAVKCMLGRPSQTRPTGFLYDDFAYVRAQPGMHTNGVASFFPWHRYFLHVYEKQLREVCGYTGNLTYWNWSKDWEGLARSPVFSDMPGFGGNGDGVTASTAGTTCINDGNFASKHVAFDYKPGFGIQPNDHCLARDFAQKDPEGRVAGAKVKPSVVQEILNQPDYESFSDKIQTGPGNIISEWVGGDFAQYTAPNDPLFILHLVNLDRLWWYWQHLEPLTRYNEYAGRRRHDFEYRATLNDTISLGTRLAPDVKVSDAMWGQSELMCYTYYL